jgi:hypothetical protein
MMLKGFLWQAVKQMMLLLIDNLKVEMLRMRQLWGDGRDWQDEK